MGAAASTTRSEDRLPRPVEQIRADFPILEREIEGRPLVYVDNAATSQKPASVIEAIDSFYRHSNSNIHRSMHQLAAEATGLYEGARAKLARFIGANQPEEIVFVRNATEAINLVRFTWAREHVGRGDVVVLTEMEHHSNIVPWQLLCQEVGARIEYLPIDDQGRLDLEPLDQLLAEGHVRLVAYAHISNVLGTINPVKEIARRVHEAGAKVLIDGAQAVPQMPVDVKQTGADFYALTGHKMLGPTGIGALWASRPLLEQMPPFMGGGSMIKTVKNDFSTWADVPAKFEAGTPPIAEAAGLGAAIDYLSELGMPAVRRHEVELTSYALERLSEVAQLSIHGPPDAASRGGLVSFEIKGMHPHDISELCGREAVCIRAGHHCAQPLMRRLGVPATARASFSVYNTRGDVDRLIAALGNAKEVFGV